LQRLGRHRVDDAEASPHDEPGADGIADADRVTGAEGFANAHTDGDADTAAYAESHADANADREAVGDVIAGRCLLGRRRDERADACPSPRADRSDA
jgi:hypothetical protein